MPAHCSPGVGSRGALRPYARLLPGVGSRRALRAYARACALRAAALGEQLQKPQSKFQAHNSAPSAFCLMPIVYTLGAPDFYPRHG